MTISIHALREEGDTANLLLPQQSLYFYPRPPRGGRPNSTTKAQAQAEISIHALREEGDDAKFYIDMIFRKFLSTPSARRATKTARKTKAINLDFYPRPPRGGRLHRFNIFNRFSTNFYPRPPRGGRQRWQCVSVDGFGFLSTPSARRATLLRSLKTSLNALFLSTPSARRATGRCHHWL